MDIQKSCIYGAKKIELFWYCSFIFNFDVLIFTIRVYRNYCIHQEIHPISLFCELRERQIKFIFLKCYSFNLFIGLLIHCNFLKTRWNETNKFHCELNPLFIVNIVIEYVLHLGHKLFFRWISLSTSLLSTLCAFLN